jgi:hypothetical protein
MLTRMLGRHHLAGVADMAQAEYYRGVLEQEKSELQALLAVQTRQLTRCMAVDAVAAASDERRAICRTERDLGVIDRMLRALGRRFPDEEDLRRRG